MRCRTCYETILDSHCHSLDEIVVNQKTLSDIILEIARIDTNDNAALEFRFLCPICFEKIKSSYEFVLQARKVNEHLKLHSTNAILDEMPIDIADTILEVKPDIENIVFDAQDVLSESTLHVEGVKTEELQTVDTKLRKSKRSAKETTKLQVEHEAVIDSKEAQVVENQSNNCTDGEKKPEEQEIQRPKRRGRPRKVEGIVKSKVLDVKTPNVRRQRKVAKKEVTSKNFGDDVGFSSDESVGFVLEDTADVDKSDESSSSSDENWTMDPLKKKRKTYKPRLRENICTVCGNSYVKHKDLIDHVKEHSIEPEFSCDYCDNMYLQKDKLDAHMKIHAKLWLNDNHKRGPNTVEFNYCKRLYEKQKIKLIQCKLCNQNFKRISELRSHLFAHKDIKTITANIAVGEADVGAHDDVKLKICKDIMQHKFIDYYMIINENGYEICLSESDITDEESEEKALSELHTRSPPRQYKCMLCDQIFNRKYKMFAHNLEMHSSDIAPLKCSVCKFYFFCEEMVRQHVRRQCRNKNKMLKCAHCPGKFKWEENSINHNCPNPFNNPTRQYKRQKKVRSLQCTHCEKIFIWAKDLQRHLQIHVADNEKLKCTFCKKKFNRKDNLKKHLKAHHGEEETVTAAINQLKYEKRTLVQGVSDFLRRPHGCKLVECLICQSKQLRMSDLKEHILQHQNDCSTIAKSWENVTSISETLYPELAKPINKEELTARITNDLASNQFQRFYSILDESGYEMNLDSSETETNSEADEEGEQDNEKELVLKENKLAAKYICEICNAAFDRKYKIFEHQAQLHQWREAKHFCTNCGSRFLSEKLLNWHFERQCKNPLKRYVCTKCPLRFMRKQNRTTHMQTHVGSTPKTEANKIFDCSRCNRSFTTRSNLERHLQVCGNDDVELLKCLYCTRKFYRNENLAAHMLRHDVTAVEIPNAETIQKATNKPNGAKKIFCRVCNLSFPSIAALRSHLLLESNSAITQHYSFESPLNYFITNSLGFEMEIDDSETEDECESNEREAIDEPKYQCFMCTLQTKRKFQMTQHQLSYHKHEELPFKCEQCVFRTVSKNILEHHLRTQCDNPNKNNVCDICRYKFMWPENLEAHKQTHHAGVQKQQITQKIYKCQQCPTKHSSKKHLNAHIKRMHRIVSSVAVDDENSAAAAAASVAVSSLEMKYLCTICGLGLNSTANLARHTRVHHTHEKPFKCNFCEKAFSCKSAVLNHRRVHTGEKPYVCTICERAFARNKGLAVHMRTHTGERPHQCPYCEKKFSTYSSLSVHRRRHTGERPYVCYCGASFIKNELLRKHRNSLGHQEIVTNVQAEAAKE